MPPSRQLELSSLSFYQTEGPILRFNPCTDSVSLVSLVVSKNSIIDNDTTYIDSMVDVVVLYLSPPKLDAKPLPSVARLVPVPILGSCPTVDVPGHDSSSPTSHPPLTVTSPGYDLYSCDSQTTTLALPAVILEVDRRCLASWKGWIQRHNNGMRLDDVWWV